MSKFLLLVATYVLPVFAMAQGPELGNIETLIDSIGRIIDRLLPLAVAAALLVFFWGLVKFILAQGDTDASEQGKKLMIWGIVALFVMVAVWGLVGFIGSALGIEPGANAPEIPTVPGVGDR